MRANCYLCAKFNQNRRGRRFFYICLNICNISPIATDLWDAPQNPLRGMMLGANCYLCANLSKIEGVVVFSNICLNICPDMQWHKATNLWDASQNHFRGDDLGANCDLCAKFEPNPRGRRFFEYLSEKLSRHLIASSD